MSAQKHVYVYPFVRQLAEPGGFWVHAGTMGVFLRSAYRNAAEPRRGQPFPRNVPGDVLRAALARL